MTAASQGEGPEVTYEVRKRVAILTLNRPATRNAQTPESERLLQELMIRADDDPEVRVVVLTGKGKDFSVGAAMAELDAVVDDGGFSMQIPLPNAQFGADIRKPVVAAINGACAGGGFIYAVTSDVRFAGADAKFTTAFARVGLAAEWAISWHVPRIVGLGHALDLLLSARPIDAQHALSIGLVNQVTEPGNAFEEAFSWAVEVADRCSPRAMATIKRSVYDDAGSTWPHAVAVSAELTRRLLTGPDLQEGATAFQEKRLPDFPPLGRSPRV
ncbi:enoyl-CoA hydratase-related protein [Nocardioides sp.]|uniref:enoyl-CoA hydratase-related protein n=1 Tax=Nocardioides sp. TaxID=35761 RepID=UPI0039E3B6F8